FYGYRNILILFSQIEKGLCIKNWIIFCAEFFCCMPMENMLYLSPTYKVNGRQENRRMKREIHEREIF
ncbi:MAG: hypothetical protein K2P19_03445, partial [Kineothrix sp.]|nr:hypothetical protein [Kineothrix sp.]